VIASTVTVISIAAHGQTVDISVSNITLKSSQSVSVGDSVWLNISYDDGRTFYLSNPEVVEVNS